MGAQFGRKKNRKTRRMELFNSDILKHSPLHSENAVVNLYTSKRPGTHWIANKKRRNTVAYFDSFGNLLAPPELKKYLGSGENEVLTTKLSYFRISRIASTCV
ncbi:hypothetical protein PR048_017964 [Dryococelus australis]|uniref:Uncharacterized protein n=1 Tax=Dryococelus australis TaxID=614101 RepID=A0ABQ9HBJ7_9NEOP|nr:hypothetical protein PR048_017964 [Dryococelus australis]